MSTSNGPLHGVRVVDFSRLGPGAFAGQCLADLGAEVTKVETLPHGDYLRWMNPGPAGVSAEFVALNQNKRSVAVDHRVESGQRIIHELTARADVFLDVSRAGTLKPFHLDADSLLELNPRLVHCSITAFGSTGPLAAWPAHGLNLESFAGLTAAHEREDGSLEMARHENGRIGALFGTSYQAAMGICAALVAVGRSGKGCKLDISCLDVGVTLDPTMATRALNPWMAPYAPPNLAFNRASPKYAPYRTRDGFAVLLCAIETKFWEAFCDLAGRPDLRAEHNADDASDYGVGSPGTELEFAL